MGLKKKSKVSAQFNMSSLTDIIFLLLIFFILTSSLVVPNALNLQLPGKKSNTSTPSKTRTTQVFVDTKGKYIMDGNSASFKRIDQKIKSLRKEDKSIIVLTPSTKTPNQYVVKILDSAFRHGVSIKLTDPR